MQLTITAACPPLPVPAGRYDNSPAFHRWARLAPQPLVQEGRYDNSPAIHRWDQPGQQPPVPEGRLKLATISPDAPRTCRSPRTGNADTAPSTGLSKQAGPSFTAGRSGGATALAHRILRISARYRGTRYHRDPLGEGSAGAVDRDPLINRTRVDCQTFVEQVLAEAVSQNTGELLPILTRIRYRDGIIGFDTRNHYMVTDWLPHNRWLIRDLTPSLGKGREQNMEKVIDRAAFFRRRGAAELGAGVRPQRDRTPYLPRRLVPGIAGQLPDGALLIWVQDRPGIIAAHCGFALRRSDGAVMFRHASERRGRVLDEPLLDYLRHAPRRIVGLKVCQARPWLDTTHHRR